MAGIHRKDDEHGYQSRVERGPYQTRRSDAGDRPLSVSFQEPPDSTLGFIYQYSQRQSQGFNPDKMNEAVDKQRNLRLGQREGSRLSHGGLESSPLARDKMMSRTLNKDRLTTRSPGLLDQTAGKSHTPGVRQELPHTPGSALKHSKYTPRKPPMGSSQFDVSDLMGQTPNRSMLTPARTFNLSMLDQSRLNSLFPATPVHPSNGALEPSAVQTPGGVTEDFTTTNMNLLLVEDPGVAASEGLFEEFMSCFTNHQSPTDVFTLVAKYQQVCVEQVDMLNNLVRKAGLSSSYGVPKKFARTVEVLRLLEQEKCTWRLIGSLYQDRQAVLEDFEDENMDVGVKTSKHSEKNIMEALFQRDSDVRQNQIIVDWLEENSRDSLRYGYDRAEFYSKSVCWENTLHSLQQQVTSGQHQSLPHLDPDAPIREKTPLADLDKEDEVRLFSEVFSNIRAGLMEEAQRLCRKCGQSWRAATLEGWRLYHDPNIKGASSGDLERIVGNKHRDIWKSVCWRMSEAEMFNVYERAIYAALSGNLKELLPACNTWDDCLWAYFKVLVDRQVEQEIRENLTISRDMDDLPASYFDKELTAFRIFQELQSHPKQIVELQSKERHHVIQKYIILGDIDALIEEMGEWLSDDVSRPSHHLVRFMAHVVLFLRSLGLQTKEEICVAIIEAYVKDLIEEKHKKLVATYTAQLPYEMQVSWYARFLEGIHDKDERQQCLQLAEEAGLDVAQITKTVVENIRTRDQTDFMDSNELSSAREAATSEEDRRKIEATDWLMFDPSQRAEALKQSNAIIRTFLACKKHEAAKEVFNKVPTDSIDLIYRNWQARAGREMLPAVDKNAIKEYLCIKAYLDAFDSFNDWFEHYHNKRPLERLMPENPNFHEKVRFEHEQKEYELELERWHQALNQQSKRVKECIFNVLLFVNGGWMVDQTMTDEDETEDEAMRQKQLEDLRKLCLPMLCSLLYTVLHTSGQYQDCVALADIIASEEYQLYKVFSRQELQQFLTKLRESSLLLLNQNLDPLGYELGS
ncbi:nuclear pore complex protein Nup107-like [Asterias rubens]|uniref:nuclear pore complex protein Nup107-like n=1 Tax=Asterias rubens TaxID=7604 RepID=UPI001455C194|nr:nuclear pore complex protein Nup107-like [Asterias rubens]